MADKKDGKKNTSFVFYESFYDAIRLLPGDEQLDALKALIEYGLTAGEPSKNLTPGQQIVLTLATPLLDANRRKRAAGSKGGRPPKKAAVDPSRYIPAGGADLYIPKDELEKLSQGGISS